MNPARLLILSLLVTGCASAPSASDPASQTLRSYEPAAAPRIVPEPLDAQPAEVAPVAFGDSPIFRLTALPADSAGAALAQEAAGPPASPHRFSGGVGIRFRGGDSALDLLVQYQYYVNSKLDVGAIADWALSPIDTLLIAPAAWWHPNDRLTVFGAPGLEFESGDGSEWALRVGGSYRLMLEKLAIRPFGWYDFVSGRQDAFVFGIGVGI